MDDSGPVITAELIQAIYQYLITRPYAEVGNIVNALNEALKPKG